MTLAEFKALITGGHFGDTLDLKRRLETLAEKIFNHSNVEVVTASKTLTKSDSGKTFLVGTDDLTITLPPTEAGLKYTFVNSGADGNNIITISPDANDAIYGTITLAASVVVATAVDDKDLINTKATTKKGDSVTLVSDGSTGWAIVASTGIWAKQG